MTSAKCSQEVTLETIVPREIADKVMDAMLIMPENLCDPLKSALTDIPEVIASAASFFRESLDGNLRVANLPYVLTFESIQEQRFQSYFTAERIRLLKKYTAENGQFPPERLREAMTLAQVKMKSFMESSEGRETILNLTLDALHDLINRPDLKFSLQEMLLEAVVMIWGSFEVFVSDALRAVANSSPELAARLFAGETKKLLSGKGISIEVLQSRNFNLSGSMGNIFFDDVRLDSLKTIRDVLSVLYPSAGALHNKMGDGALWKLWQRRNLITHRRGMVDQFYLDKTGDLLPIGQRIRLTGRYVEESAILVRDAGIEMIAAIRLG
jgi:hypothetical protein